MKTIYCDGIFDLFHHGHLQHIAKIHTLFDEPISLLVGVVSDKVATNYKRPPIWNEQKRLSVLNACIHVCEAFITDILMMDEDFLETHHIDYVVHGFTEEDKKKQSAFFEVPIRLGKFIEIDYHTGVSTSQIIEDHKITKQRLTINTEYIGYEFPFDVQDGHKVLLVGPYLGGNIGTQKGLCLMSDYDADRVSQTSHSYPILPFSSTIPIFKDHYFDYVFCFGNERITSELFRVSKRGVFSISSTKYNV